MQTKKDRKNKLVGLACDVIGRSTICANGNINKSYNGQIAAFSVSVAMSGIKPTMAIYMSDSDNTAVNRKYIVELIAHMYKEDCGTGNITAEGLYDMVIQIKDSSELAALAGKIIEYAIALKLAVRTYNLV